MQTALSVFSSQGSSYTTLKQHVYMYMYIRPSVLLPLPSCPCWLFSLFLQLKGFQWRLFFISFFNLCLDFRLANHFELRLVFLSVPIGGWLHLTAKRKNKNRTCYQCTFTPSCFSCFWFVPSPQLQNTQVSRTKTLKKNHRLAWTCQIWCGDAVIKWIHALIGSGPRDHQ